MWSRLCRFSLMMVCVAGLGSTSQAQWMYDSYTPYYAGYAPYYTGYSGYSGYSGVYASSYSPGLACSGCQPSCGCSPCMGSCGTGCASGNCASGNCATTTNSTPSGSLTPVPDPNSSARNFESRLEAIERHLNLRTPTKPRTYDDPFKSRNPGTGGAVDRVQPDDTNFGAPKRGGVGADDPNAPFEENTKKQPLPAPVPGIGNEGTSTSGTGASESVIQTKKPAAGTVDENSNKKGDQGLRLDTRITSRAVSPRERQTITIGGANAAVATAKKPAPKVDARTVNVAKY